MKASLLFLSVFIAGVLFGVFRWMPQFLLNDDVGMYLVYILLVFVGMSIGGDGAVIGSLLHLNFRSLLVPFSVGVGSIAGAGLLSLVLQGVSLREGLAVGAGFGYYSLSSVLITRIYSEELGAIALLSNIFREVSTLVFAPLYVRFFGELAPIAGGAATSMDVTLPVIQKFSGNQYVMVAVINGVVLSIFVPVIITLILS